MPPTVRAARAAAAPVITWARTFPAVPAQVGEARRFLAGVLDGDPACDDAALCLSELASNADAPRGALLYPRCSREGLKGGSWA